MDSLFTAGTKKKGFTSSSGNDQRSDLTFTCLHHLWLYGENYVFKIESKRENSATEWMLRELTHWSLQFRNSPGYYGVSRIIPHMGNEEMCYRILSSCNMSALASVSQAFEQRGRVISSSPTPDHTHTHTLTQATLLLQFIHFLCHQWWWGKRLFLPVPLSKWSQLQ